MRKTERATQRKGKRIELQRTAREPHCEPTAAVPNISVSELLSRTGPTPGSVIILLNRAAYQEGQEHAK